MMAAMSAYMLPFCSCNELLFDYCIASITCFLSSWDNYPNLTIDGFSVRISFISVLNNFWWAVWAEFFFSRFLSAYALSGKKIRINTPSVVQLKNCHQFAVRTFYVLIVSYLQACAAHLKNISRKLQFVVPLTPE